MTNIWIINHYAITPEMTGSTRHYDFALELIKRDYNVTIFSSSFRHQGKREESKLKKNEKWKIEKINGINFIWIKTFPYQKNDWRRVVGMTYFMYRAYWLGRKIIKIKKDINRPNIILGSSPHLLSVFSAYWLSKYYKTKFIMEVRDLWPQTFVDMGKIKENSPIIKILRILEKFLYKKADKIIILPPLAKNYINSLKIDENKVVWISNGVDLSKFVLPNPNNNKKIQIIYSGAFGLANAVEMILKAAEIIQKQNYKNIKFLLFGNGPEKENLIKYTEEKRINNLKILSSVSKKEIIKKLIGADILMVHFKKSKIHQYGVSFNKLFDYMAASKTIIFAVDAGNNPIEDANCGISIPPENPEKMAEAIIKLYNMSPEERQKMGENGRKYVEKYNSIPVLVNKLEKIL